MKSLGRRNIEQVPTSIQGGRLPEVSFFPWDTPLLQPVASALLDRFRAGGAADLRECLLVVPGARAGRRLLELLVTEASHLGLRLVPPRRILTVGALPEELYQPRLPLAPGAAVRQGWVRALEEMPVKTVEVALGPYAAGRDPGAMVAFAHLLEGLNRTVGGAGVPFSTVATECRRGFLFSDEERWRALSRIQESMRSKLKQVGMMDREEARQEAVAERRAATEDLVVLVGVAEAPRVTRQMLESVSGKLVIFVHAPGSEEDAFDALGTVRVDRWQDRAVPIPDEDLLVGDTPWDQAELVTREVERLSGAYAGEEITVGVPDPSVVPFLAQQLEARGFKCRYAEGTPLSLSSPVQLLQAVAEYLAGGRFGALADLLRHPDLPPFLQPESGPELADAYFQQHFPDRVLPGHWLESTEGEALTGIEGALRRPQFLGKLEGSATLSDWMPKILSFLGAFYREESFLSHTRQGRRVLEALIQIRDASDTLHRLPPPLDASCTAPQALRVLLGELKDGRIPPEPDGAAVEMVGWLELQLDDAPVVLLTGVCDPFLPESVNADPFLPNALRGRLGLEDNRARYARDAYRLTALVRSSENRLIIAARRTAAGDSLRPSRLLLTGTDREVAYRVLRLTGEGPLGEMADGDPKQSPEADGVQRFHLPPEPRLRIGEIPRPLPVTAFRAILDDPYLWALSVLRPLQEADYYAQELDPGSFGNLAHTILEQFARSAEARSDDPDAIRRRLDGLLNREARRVYGPTPLPAVPLQVEQLRARLATFAEWQARRAQGGWEIICAEARTGPGGVPFLVDGEPVFLSGRIDRIDQHGESDAWTVFDYKTSEGGVSLSSVRGRDGRWKDLQLPLYRHLLTGLYRPGGEPLDSPPPGTNLILAYLPLSEDAEALQEVTPDWSEEDLAAADETAREVIRKLRDSGEVLFDPARSGRGAWGGLATLLGHGLLSTEGVEE